MSVTASESWAEGPNMNISEEPCNRSSPKTSPPEGKKQKSKPSTGKTCAVSCLEVGTSYSKKILPALRGRGNDFYTEGDLIRSAGQKDFIPLDILASLTQIPSPPSKEQLGPPSKFKKNVSVEKSIRKRPANVWNYNKGREKLKHLVENPPCLCGAGRDISFLYDALTDKKDKVDEKIKQKTEVTPGTVVDEFQKKDLASEKDGSSSAPPEASQIPITLVPAEYHLVKDPGVLGLEFSDDIHTTHLKEHEEHLTIFPSMKPSGRQEVLKLKHAFEAMLSRAGVDDESKELAGPTQIHNLLEIVKKEQNIYNIVFNELIRQCTIECAERGELLASLRKRYAQLLDRVPRQVMSLHQEVLAQRALDRRLTEELIRFKANVSALTDELDTVKAHDHEVTKQALQVQQELNEALMESDKNANLLEEYHELYELQRKRLEIFVRTLTEERDLWGSASYILALKVTDHHKLNVAKRLHLHERAVSRLARHFTLSLSQKDSEQLQDVVTNFQVWKDLAEKFNHQLIKNESNLKTNLEVAIKQLQRWRSEFERVVSPDQGRVQAPGKELVEELLSDMKAWEDMCNKEAEKFVGGNLLSCQDQLYHLYKKVEGWTDVAHKVFRRHQQDGQNVRYSKEMAAINQNVEKLHRQFQIRASGENGVAKGLINMSNPMESWCNKLHSVVHGSEELLDPEWIRLADQVGNEWLENMKEISLLIGSQLKDGEREVEELETSTVNFDELCKAGKLWLTNMTNSVENDDGKLMQIVSDLHSTMLRWMITVLLRLAPDVEVRDLEEISSEDDLKGALGGGEILLESTSQEIKTRADRLAQDLRTYSKVIQDCCGSIVMESMLEKKDRYEDDAEVEYNDLKRIEKECEGWIRTSELLVKQVVGELPSEGIKIESMLTSGRKGSLLDSEGTSSTARSTPVKGADPETLQETPVDVGALVVPATPNYVQPEVIVVEDEKGTQSHRRELRPNSSDSATKIRVLAEDETVGTRELKDGEKQEVPSSSDVFNNDEPNSFQPLETVQKLQDELLEAEERAQRAEQRALDAENELKKAMEKIRSLEREASRPTSAQSTEALDKPANGQVTPQNLSTPFPRASSRQPLSRASSGSSTSRKKK